MAGTGKTGFVLGAGFSKAAGCPLVGEFTRKTLLRSIARKLSDKKESSRFRRLVDYFRSRIEDGYCADNIVEDCDAVYRRTLKAGGISVMEATDMETGEGYGGVKDPSGNVEIKF